MHPLEIPILYNFWQQLVGRGKLSIFLRQITPQKELALLDIGSGPATYYPQLCRFGYTGIDLDSAYINQALARYPEGRFYCCNATALSHDKLGSFDIILINSLLHHLDDHEVRTLMESLKKIAKPGAKVVLIDMLLHKRSYLSNFLAYCDRGRYPRTLAGLLGTLPPSLKVTHMEHHNISFFGISFWRLVTIFCELSNEG